MADSDSLADLINDVPADLADENKEDTEVVEDKDDSTDEDTTTDADTEEVEEDAEDGKDTDDDKTTDTDEDDNDDYITRIEDDEEDTPVTPPAPPAQGDETEAKFILEKLQKIPVNIINAAGKVETVQVYGYGDLPRDYKGIATPYEAGVFQAAVTEQQAKARDLQNQYRQTQSQDAGKKWEAAENRMIADDLKELREEGIFPKFKGSPNTKEFDNSAGAKEFDRVVEFMNKRNDEYIKANQAGKAYKHIGFAEAFDLLNPGIREKENAEDQARRGVARKLKSTQGARAEGKKVSSKPVTNLTDLEDEFKIFTGANA
jgi:hypothetical protein